MVIGLIKIMVTEITLPIGGKKMCGRFTLSAESTEIEARFDCQPGSLEFNPRYNIAPTQTMPVVIKTAGKNQLQLMQWGLVPFWAKDPATNTPLINARIETVSEKPAFKSSLIRRRCIVPADGYYEWQKYGK
jgi:putative SOS response-associated peptidase YedK